MIPIICSGFLGEAEHCLVMVQDVMTSLDTGLLLYSNQRGSLFPPPPPPPQQQRSWLLLPPLRSLLARKVSRDQLLPPLLPFLHTEPELSPLSLSKPWTGSQSCSVRVPLRGLQTSRLVHDMTERSAGAKWSPLTPLEARSPGLFCSAVSLLTWNMRCSQECPVLLLLHFVLLLAAGHEELSDPGRFLSFFADQGQCGAVYILLAEAACVRMLQVNAWVGKVCAYQNQYAAKVKICPWMCLCCMWFCRSVVPVRPVHCPSGENHRRWRLHLPLCVPPPQGWASQAWPATPGVGGTGLLQG